MFTLNGYPSAWLDPDHVRLAMCRSWWDWGPPANRDPVAVDLWLDGGPVPFPCTTTEATP